MISLDYVNHGSCFLENEMLATPIMNYLESCKTEIEDIESSISLAQDKVALEYSIMGKNTNDNIMVYESEKNNFFERIGKIVVNIYTKFIEFVDKIIDKIKNLSFRKKSDTQKLEILLKKHPELKNEVITAFNNGVLDLNDVKSLKELDATFDEIMRLSKKREYDEKTIRGKWQRAIDKFETDEKSWKVVKVAAATTTVVTAIAAVATLKSKLAKGNSDLIKMKEESAVKYKEIKQQLNAEKIIDNNTGRYTTLLQCWRELHGKQVRVVREYTNIVDKLANGIASFLDKHVSAQTQMAKNAQDERTARRVAIREANKTRETAKQSELGKNDGKTIISNLAANNATSATP